MAATPKPYDVLSHTPSQQAAIVATLAHETKKKDSIDLLQSSFGELSNVLISSKLEQQSVIAQSVAAGGPGSPHEALLDLMDYLKVGIRALARATKVKRKLLLSMLEGRIDMPPEVLSAIHDHFKKINPKLFND